MNTDAAQILNELFELAHFCAARGWVPATSGNFSVCDGDGHILISRSGFDKSKMGFRDLVELDREGSAQPRPGLTNKPSAEAGLHAVIYRERPEARAIAHVHTVWSALLSDRYAGQPHIAITDYEILKGLAGVTTHEHEERIPLLANTQDYAALEARMKSALDAYPGAHGVLLVRHGLYTWGQSVAEARRHLEALEFLFEVEARRLMGRL